MRFSKKLISVMLSLLMIAAMLPITAQAVSGIQASEMTSSVSGMTSFNNMPSSFVETNLEKAKTWSGAPSASYTYLVYDIESGVAYCAYFYQGTYSAQKSFNLSNFRNLPDSGYRVYYVTYAGEQEPAETPVVKVSQLTADKVAKMTTPVTLPEDFVATDSAIAKTWKGAAATGTTTLIYGTEGVNAIAAMFVDGIYYMDYNYNLETINLSELADLVTAYPVYYTVAKNTPAYEIPTDLTGVFGETLQSVALPDGWSWEDGSVELGNVGENEHVAIFTPEDTENYITVKEILKVDVKEVDKTALKAAIDEAEAYYAAVKDNEEYAEALEGLDAAITDANVTFENPNVLAATVDDKADVLMTKLAIAQYKITEIDNANAIARFNAAMQALPATLVYADVAKVVEADNAYDALTNEQKDIIGTAALKAAQVAIKDYKMAMAAVISAHYIDGVIGSDKEAVVEGVRAFYDGLTDEQKALVDASVVQIIEDSEAVIPVIKAIEALPEFDIPEKKAAITAAREAYEALTDDQKAKIAEETLAALEKAEADLAIGVWYTEPDTGKKYYYLYGEPVKGKQTIDGKTYIFGKKNGELVYGKVKCDGKYYITDKNNGEMLFGKVNFDGKTYITGKKNGEMLYGRVKCDGKWYITGKKNGEMLYGKVKCDGKWYIASKKDGHLVLNQKVKCDGKTYKTNKNGVIIK